LLCWKNEYSKSHLIAQSNVSGVMSPSSMALSGPIPASLKLPQNVASNTLLAMARANLWHLNSYEIHPHMPRYKVICNNIMRSAKNKINVCVFTLHPPFAFSEPTLKVQSYKMLDSYICSKSVLTQPVRCISFLPVACWKSMAKVLVKRFLIAKFFGNQKLRAQFLRAQSSSGTNPYYQIRCQNE